MAIGKANGVFGLGWGDEAKGKEVDLQAAVHDLIVRYNGGPNAGHTVKANGKVAKLHQIPSGALHPGKRMYIASGCVVDMPGIRQEMEELADIGYDDVPSRLRISSQASVIQPHHALVDIATMYAIGTTGKGIGPAYGSQAYRMEGTRNLNIQMGEMLEDPEHCFATMRENLLVELDRVRSGVYKTPPEVLNRLFGKDSKRDFNPDKEMDAQRRAFEQMQRMNMIDTDPEYVIKLMRAGLQVLLEGAQAFGIDLRHGASPYVTASRVSMSSAFDSANIPMDPQFIGWKAGVYKATPSRVGHGPFPSEFGGSRSAAYCMEENGDRYRREVEQAMYGHRLDDMLAHGDALQMSQALRLIFDEYGATSGRPRRIGAPDTVWLANAVRLLDINRLIISAVDRLQVFHKVPGGIPLVWQYSRDGVVLDRVPNTVRGLGSVETSVKHLEPFSEDISGMRTEAELPSRARAVIRHIEEGTNCRVHKIGVGPGRDQVIELSA